MLPTWLRRAPLLAALALTACAMLRDTPDETARSFWAALAEGDFDRARALSTADSELDLSDLAERFPLEEIHLGDTLLSERRAVVETHASLPERRIEVSFETHLVRPERAWRVDVEQTRSALVQAALASAFRELQKTLDRGSDVLSEFLEQNAVELSESMRETIEQLEEALGETPPPPPPP